MTKITRSLFSVPFAVIAALCALAMTSLAAHITTASLLEEMTSLKSIPEFPSPAYICKQFSSYDRASKSPSENWFANGDAGQFLRVDKGANGEEHVMMDADGPGAIVRIWSANPVGTIRIYIDGKPEIVAPTDVLLGGKFAGLPKPMAGEYSKGWNLYFPIPYEKHCKVTCDKGGFYYHVNYRTYVPGTKVRSFKASDVDGLGIEIARVAKVLSDPWNASGGSMASAEPFRLEIQPGATVTSELEGPAAVIESIVTVVAGNREAALRGVVLRARFDGEKCIEAPIGDFFGSAPGINAYESLPLGMFKDGRMYCRWVMPFQHDAVFELWNTTKETVRVEGEMTVAPYNWTENSMHFHAGWRAQFDIPTRPMLDWNYLTAQGQGVFAGVSFAIDNPVKHWWGEGDEKIYVDGESFPSHFGTGTEDYYGYAWCWPGLFTHAYHSQSRCDGPGNYGRTSVNRFHILDRIPFNKSFKFDMELWHWHEKTKVNAAVTAYWYGRPGAQAQFPPVTREMTVVRPLEPYVAQRVSGAIEGETLRIVKVTGVANPQDWADLSNEQHLWWHEGVKQGGTLEVVFPVPKAGKYKVFARFLTAKDYGIHQLSINGVNAGEPIDFYNPEVVPTPERELGTFELKEGDNSLLVTAVGSNPKAIKALMFGLDYLALREAR